MTNHDMFNTVIILFVLACLIIAVIVLILKICLYIKMKQDGEIIKSFYKTQVIIGMISMSICIVYTFMLIKRLNQGIYFTPIPLIASSHIPFDFLSSICFVGNKSVVIGTKRYFYSDIAKIENKFSTYIFTMSDGEVKKSYIMCGNVKKINSELKKALPKLTANI